MSQFESPRFAGQNDGRGLPLEKGLSKPLDAEGVSRLREHDHRSDQVRKRQPVSNVGIHEPRMFPLDSDRSGELACEQSEQRA